MGDALLAQIFDPEVNDGIGLVVDGFPRTALQVTIHVHHVATIARTDTHKRRGAGAAKDSAISPPRPGLWWRLIRGAGAV